MRVDSQFVLLVDLLKLSRAAKGDAVDNLIFKSAVPDILYGRA